MGYPAAGSTASSRPERPQPLRCGVGVREGGESRSDPNFQDRMLPFFLAVVVGLVAIVWSADRFVAGASALARHLGITPLVVGLVIVGVGTSAPELLISAVAALDGNPEIAVGNAIGSNIANAGLVIGVCALVGPLDVRSETLRREFPMMLAVTGLVWMLLIDDELGQFDAAVMLAVFATVMLGMVWLGRNAGGRDRLAEDFEVELADVPSCARSVALLLMGLVVLGASSRAIVWGASNIASAFGVSDLLIGLSIVAVGTSLPELAASIASVLKKEPEIAIGNVLGSNMFNLLPVLALPGLIAPGGLAPEVMTRDFPVMAGISVALLLFASGFRGKAVVNRWEGAALLLGFVGYQTFLLHVS